MTKTLLLPTTIGVNESISMKEAIAILKSNGIMFEVAGNVVSGMYKADNGEIVEEELLPIVSNMSADALAVMFTQECILESDGKTAQLVAQNGDVWADFDGKVEYNLDSELDAIAIQSKLANHFGGASRIDNNVWAWGNTESISKWA